MTAADPKPRPRTTDIEAGRYYSPAFVGALFGFTAEWARQQCKATGRFPRASKLTGSNAWLIPGSDVLAVIGRQQMDIDRKAAAAETETPAQLKRRGIAARKRLEKMGAI